MSSSPADAPSTPSRPGAELRAAIADLVRHRELLVELTRRDLTIRYKQAAMGLLWAVLTPLVVALSGWLVRYAFGFMSGAPVAASELAGIALKSLGWSFIVGAIGFGTASIVANYPLVTKVYFPRAVLPLSAVGTQVIDSAIGAIAVAILLPALGVWPTASWLWAPVLIALLVILTAALALLTAAANVFFRDVRHVVQMATSFGIFFTPVFYEASAFREPGHRLLLMLNPFAPLLEGLRLAVVDGHDLLAPLADAAGVTVWTPWYLLYAAAWSILGGLAALAAFRRAEFLFAEYV